MLNPNSHSNSYLCLPRYSRLKTILPEGPQTLVNQVYTDTLDLESKFKTIPHSDIIRFGAFAYTLSNGDLYTVVFHPRTNTRSETSFGWNGWEGWEGWQDCSDCTYTCHINTKTKIISYRLFVQTYYDPTPWPISQYALMTMNILLHWRFVDVNRLYTLWAGKIYLGLPGKVWLTITIPELLSPLEYTALVALVKLLLTFIAMRRLLVYFSGITRIRLPWVTQDWFVDLHEGSCFLFVSLCILFGVLKLIIVVILAFR